jgi:hypothetical protein
VGGESERLCGGQVAESVGCSVEWRGVDRVGNRLSQGYEDPTDRWCLAVETGSVQTVANGGRLDPSVLPGVL